MEDKSVSLKLSPQKLLELFKQGVLCAADLECLDLASRDIVRDLCLEACIEKVCASCSLNKECSSSFNLAHKAAIHPVFGLIS